MASRFWVGGTGTWDTTDTTHWASVTNGAGGASVPTSADTVALDANSGSGTITINGNHSIVSFAHGAGGGLTIDFSANNNNLTCSGNFSHQSASANTLKLGNGTFTVGGWVVQDAALTFDAGNATVVITDPTGANDRSFIATLSNLAPKYVVLGPMGGIGGISAGQNSFATNLTVIGPVKFRLSANRTLTVSTTFTLVNTKGRPIEFRGIGSTISGLSVPSGTVEFNWSSFRNIAFQGGATFVAKNSFDLGLNTGITISPPRSGLILGG